MITAINLSDRRRVVTTRDPAIDPKKSDLKTYAKTLDLSLLQFRPNEVPTFFTIRPLASSEHDRCMQASFRIKSSSEEERGYVIIVNAARLGITKIENFPAEGQASDYKKGLPQEVADVLDTASTVELGQWILEMSSAKTVPVDVTLPALPPTPEELQEDEGKSLSPG